VSVGSAALWHFNSECTPGPCAHAVNRPCLTKLPVDEMPLFEGSHADLLIIGAGGGAASTRSSALRLLTVNDCPSPRRPAVLHKLLVDGSPKLSTLYSCFLTVVCNVRCAGALLPLEYTLQKSRDV
jgi:hypothetical protein